MTTPVAREGGGGQGPFLGRGPSGVRVELDAPKAHLLGTGRWLRSPVESHRPLLSATYRRASPDATDTYASIAEADI